MSVRQGTRRSHFPDEKADVFSHTKHTAVEQGARTRTQDLMPQHPALPRNLCHPPHPARRPPSPTSALLEALLLRRHVYGNNDTVTGRVWSGSQELRHPVALRPSSRWGFSTGRGLQRPLCTERASLKATPRAMSPGMSTQRRALPPPRGFPTLGARVHSWPGDTDAVWSTRNGTGHGVRHTGIQILAPRYLSE